MSDRFPIFTCFHLFHEANLSSNETEHDNIYIYIYMYFGIDDRVVCFRDTKEKLVQIDQARLKKKRGKKKIRRWKRELIFHARQRVGNKSAIFFYFETVKFLKHFRQNE